MIRLFVALDLPGEAREALAGLEVGEGWRRVRPEGLHVTLAFLGWREPTDVAAIDTAVRPAARGPVRTLCLGDAVLLPPRRPRVMAVSLDDPSGDAVRVQAAIAESLASAGLYEPERRPWLPHVTLARTRAPARRGAPVPDVPMLEFTPLSATLYQSVMGAGGSRYEVVERYPLP